MFDTKKILIVDDEEQSRLYLAEILHTMRPEYSISLASTPAEALFIAKKDCLHLIFLDVEMPGMTGLDMLSELRKSQPSIPVIFISAYKRAEFIQRALRLDAIDYLDKPIDPIELECALVKVFNTHKNASALNKDLERFHLLTHAGDMFVDVDNIVYFSSDKRYSKVYFSDNSSTNVRENLETLDKKLPEKHFLRVSRQYIVNINCIQLVSKSNKTITLNACQLQQTLTRIYPHIIRQLVEEYKL